MSIERVDGNNDEIADSEREQFALVVDDLDAELDRLETYIDSDIDPSPGEDETPHGVSGEHDWGFY